MEWFLLIALVMGGTDTVVARVGWTAGKEACEQRASYERAKPDVAMTYCIPSSGIPKVTTPREPIPQAGPKQGA